MEEREEIALNTWTERDTERAHMEMVGLQTFCRFSLEEVRDCLHRPDFSPL